MAIRITRNEAGNCITFVGSSNPAYWNSCLSAQINTDDADRFDIINDVRSLNDVDTQYEFYAVDFNDFADKDGNPFANVQEAIDYINTNANVLGVSSDGINLTGMAVNFRLDETSTSIIMDNGSAFGVNTIKAVATDDGTIHIHAIGAGQPNGLEGAGDLKHFEGLEVGNVSVNGAVVAGGIQTIANTLNELFTVGAFEAVVITDPFATNVADVGGVVDSGSAVGSNAVDPIGDDILGSSSSHYNKAGWLSDESLDQAGEYFTFDIRVTDSMGFGFVLDQGADLYGAGSYADPAMFCNDSTGNNAAFGYYWSHWFHSGNKGPWTYYGQRTSSSIRPGWSGFGSSDERVDYIADEPIKMKVGIDANGYMEVAYYDESESVFIPIQRSNYVLAEGQSVKLGIKIYGTRGRLHTVPKKHLLEPAAPTMYFRYIESPDGNYEYPLFVTEEEANYYDSKQSGGTGTSHTHTYNDDPTATTWYMPDTNSTMTATAAPSGVTFEGNAVTYTEITSYTNADLSPSAFSGLDYSYEEGTAVNFQLYPAGATWTQTVTVSPSGSGMVYNAATGHLQGTLADVGTDTTYTVTVTRANAYGSSVGTFEVVATDVAPVQTNNTPWTRALDFSGSNEHLKQVTQSSGSNAVRMSGFSSLAVANADLSKSSNDSLARPWATAVVFQTPNNTSNQHIWNSGEGAGTNGDNIYLRITGTNGALYFGWGREGVGYNECLIGNLGGSYNQSTGQWWGIYIAHKGQRFNSANATAQNLADAFDIKLMGTNDTIPMGGIYTVGDSASDWTSTGYRMDRDVTGDFTIGGRGSNRSFHGKVASMIITTLRRGYTMPDNTEAELMLTDPKKWEDDYRVGQTVRANNSGSNTTYDVTNGKYGTQIWLMGDGTSDSYSNGIRNEVDPTDQNYTKLQLNSMVSNDIQTVNIPGLT